ncbi:MAG: hypothetical protein U0P30_15795 [Vicinamibacterales bacterium]
MSTRLPVRSWMMALGLGVAVAGVVFGASSAVPAARPLAPVAAQQGKVTPRPTGVIDHQVPRPDYVGKQPSRFAWTAAPEADHYAIGVWDEVERLIWRADDITGTTVQRPPDLNFAEGTYFWTVSALRGTQEIARSGLAAFVVEK